MSNCLFEMGFDQARPLLRGAADQQAATPPRRPPTQYRPLPAKDGEQVFRQLKRMTRGRHKIDISRNAGHAAGDQGQRQAFETRLGAR